MARLPLLPLLLLPLSLLAACTGGGIGTGKGASDDPDDADGDGFLVEEDCDDNDDSVYPGATEVCNGKDDDCDGGIDLFDSDLSDGIAAFMDRDGDGFGDASAPTVTCTLGEGAVEDDSDCNDNDALVHPGAVERCSSGADDDCDGSTNDPDAEGCIDVYVDADGDGFGGAESICLCTPDEDYPRYFDDDCDDAEPTTNPEAPERCNDFVDNDCDGGANDCELAGNIEMGSADGTVVGLSAGDGTGTDLTRTGDLNGDGLDDFAVLAPGYQGSQGAVAAFAMDFSGELELDQGLGMLLGTATDGGLSRIEGGQDLDGDGLMDILVASRSTAGGDGAIWLWSGPPAGTTLVDSLAGRLDGPLGDQAGLMAPLPDVSGDGIADLLVGAYDSGDIYVVQGPLTSRQSVALVGQRITGAGYSLSALGAVGDLDGDGLTDLAVGAESRGGSGRVWLLSNYSASFGALADADGYVDGDLSEDLFGASLAGVGDLTGDGYDDVLVGAPGVDVASRNEGAAFLLAGPVTGSPLVSDIAWASFTGEYVNDATGTDVDGGGDLNADGSPDLIIGSPGHEQAGRDAGMVYIHYGPVSGSYELRLADAFLEGRGSREEAGRAVRMVGDLQGDGFDDIAAGSPGNDIGGDSAGVVDLFFGAGL